jgi:ketosteroid isomerase-like protein
MRGITTLIALLLIWILLPGEQVVLAASDAGSIAQVWDREEEYDGYVKAGDVENYKRLWHKDFIGWPCGQDHPVGKTSIGKGVQEIRDNKIVVESTMTREGAQDFGDVVVVHYSCTEIDTYPDGRVEGHGKQFKITHTWMKVGDTWQIIGGMCGTLPDTVK